MRAPVSCLAAFAGVILTLALASAQTRRRDDFRWMHGANYIPSYAATDVEMWLDYDFAVIERELGYARKIGLNSVRVFLQSLVYDRDPGLFLERFDDFLSRAARHGIKVMPILFDSCFGVAPSLESRHIWVANPGPDRMKPEFWPASDAYATAVVSAHAADPRIALWDVMNEPTSTFLAATPEGRAEIEAFLAHKIELVRKYDRTHPLTVGVATADNTGWIDKVDVLSCHSYAASREAYRKDLAVTSDQAPAAGKPGRGSETAAPGWGNEYEMVMPVLRELRVGHTVWELMIGRNQFSRISGLLYPDGTARRLSQVEAVMNAPARFLVEKPDSEGVPLGSTLPDRILEYVRFTARNPVTEATWRERNTLVFGLAKTKVFADRENEVVRQLEEARKDYAAGYIDKAFAAVGELLRAAASILEARNEKPAPPRRPGEIR